MSASCGYKPKLVSWKKLGSDINTAFALQQLANEDRKQAKRDAGRDDMKWQINVEVHDPEIGLVSIDPCLPVLHSRL